MHDLERTQPRRHPSSTAIADFLMGVCSPGSSLLLGNHARLCPQCREKLIQLGAPEASPQAPRFVHWQTVAAGLEITELPEFAGLGESVYGVRMAPGARAELAVLRRPSELLVLKGSFRFSDEDYAGGDFLLFAKGSDGEVVAGRRSGLMALATAELA
jgi:hypothetical protein